MKNEPKRKWNVREDKKAAYSDFLTKLLADKNLQRECLDSPAKAREAFSKYGNIVPREISAISCGAELDLAPKFQTSADQCVVPIRWN